MSSIKARVEAGFKRFESKLGIDREGRTVWVWLLPPGMGLVTAVMVLFMPGLSSGMGLFGTLTLAIFGLLAVTTIASIYLIAFDNDHNQQAPIEDPPATGHEDGGEMPPAPSGSPPPLGMNALATVSSTEDDWHEHAGDGVQHEVRSTSGTPR
jgi:hypothetical protein